MIVTHDLRGEIFKPLDIQGFQTHDLRGEKQIKVYLNFILIS